MKLYLWMNNHMPALSIQDKTGRILVVKSPITRLEIEEIVRSRDEGNLDCELDTHSEYDAWAESDPG